jgi:hypothetical protein
LQSLSEFNFSYSGLFEDRNPEEDERNKQADAGYHERFGWLIVIDALSNGNGKDWEFYTDMNVIEFMNRIVFMKIRNQESGIMSQA